MNITCLLENTTLSPDLDCGHGLSLFIETGGTALLFDLGPDTRTLSNAAHLGIDLSRVNLAVISHGHRDHGGGLSPFRKTNPGAEVIMTGAAARGSFFVRNPGGLFREISTGDWPASDPRCRLIEDDTRISDHLSLFTGFGSGTFMPKANADLFRQSRDKSRKKAMAPDDFSHELALLVTAENSTALFTGCSHSGIPHMISTVLNRTGLDHIDVVIGGFHLFNPATGETESRSRLDDLAEELSRFRNTRFYTGHCTGETAFGHLKQTLGKRLLPLSTGTRIRI